MWHSLLGYRIDGYPHKFCVIFNVCRLQAALNKWFFLRNSLRNSVLHANFFANHFAHFCFADITHSNLILSESMLLHAI
jgi:hypothetical protein